MRSSGDTRKRRGMEDLVGYVLLAGVLLSAGLIAAGWIWRWAETGRFHFDYALPKQSVFRFAVGEVRRAVGEPADPRTLVSGGILVLLLTPYLRVFLSMLYFLAVERDWTYTAVTAFVFLALTLSLVAR